LDGLPKVREQLKSLREDHSAAERQLRNSENYLQASRENNKHLMANFESMKSECQQAKSETEDVRQQLQDSTTAMSKTEHEKTKLNATIRGLEGQLETAQ
jgi:chromosome segregation ATPase